ncbi:phytanoyl-CoA dioxygenase family protein [bacterium]|nr:phytanoyl-CoA dioxygenase family protein [bacterium]
MSDSNTSSVKTLSAKLLEDGAVKLKSFFSLGEVEKIQTAINDTMAKPSAFSSLIEDDTGSFFMDYNNWRRLKSIKEICTRPQTTEFIQNITGCEKVWLFHDHVLVKNGQAPATPWHHDRPYYIFKGDLNLSIWTPTDAVPADQGMVFLRGSHKTEKLYVPKSFRDGSDMDLKEGFDRFDPKLCDQFEHLTFNLERGDSVIFLNNVLHSAPAHKNSFSRSALSVRYLVGNATLTENYVNATPPFDRLGVTVAENGAVPEDKFPLLS